MDLVDITYSPMDGFAEIVLDRPDALNPISAASGGTRDQILAALAMAEADPAVGAAVIRGAGRAFSAGGDLTGNARRESAAEELGFVEGAARFHAALRATRIPVVAAVHGYCLGAALGLVAACDLVVASHEARFGLPEGRLGLVGATPLVPVIGRQWAKYLIMTGEMIGAEQAARIGLVLTVVAADGLVERARDLAGRLARMPSEAIALNKRAIDATADGIESGGLATGVAHDAVTLANSSRAMAPDGRPFRDIIAAEGMDGLKKARAQQWDTPWLVSPTA
ncbi:enoyl-CoA hydratase/isomerase family protein [Acidiferrimicrobium sp. IK]|uniref:enoyl-CoA hydratase/isomerase family protein n=1 Tax=Acidiferrimicrobium sp. IK TaxID=2871700 RepID=UPI0021CB54BB|nr:enoyl-CoA hydratase/isomerase family protein [Acidiferrimicrobium sp. IK]MCU4183471.1 enoyl-CoA hydratase/isomerase family protein [Acidiferrimicrobium sp. IK]